MSASTGMRSGRLSRAYAIFRMKTSFSTKTQAAVKETEVINLKAFFKRLSAQHAY